jgi:hypothetical protein
MLRVVALRQLPKNLTLKAVVLPPVENGRMLKVAALLPQECSHTPKAIVQMQLAISRMQKDIKPQLVEIVLMRVVKVA